MVSPMLISFVDKYLIPRSPLIDDGVRQKLITDTANAIVERLNNTPDDEYDALTIITDFCLIPGYTMEMMDPDRAEISDHEVNTQIRLEEEFNQIMGKTQEN